MGKDRSIDAVSLPVRGRPEKPPRDGSLKKRRAKANPIASTLGG